VEVVERIATQRADDLAAGTACFDDAGRAQPTQVPGNERLRQIYVLDELRDRGRPLSETLEQTEAGRVRQRLVVGGDGT
jgi:hypothetical protein